MTSKDYYITSGEEFSNEIEKFKERLDLDEVTRKAISESNVKEIEVKVNKGKWHVRGVIYHCNQLVKAYREVAKGVAKRAHTTHADKIIMNNSDVQKIMFEFYALVNLAKISLDNLQFLSAPLFINDFNQLPKSISDFIKGDTDCPLYDNLAKEECVEYLIDIRNCLVHYRTFATSDNVEIDHEDIYKDDNEFSASMAKGEYRFSEDGKVVFNMYLPDKIFQRNSSGKKLCDFTYEKKINIASQGKAFAELILQSYSLVFNLLIEPGAPQYTYG